MRDGLVTLLSHLGAAETLERLMAAVRARGLVVFATIDHAQAARDAGLDLNFASLVIFGSARAGTPLMRRAPTLAIDLPLKALIWADADGAIWLSYNQPTWLAERHGLCDLDAPTMIWEQEGGAVGAGPESVVAAKTTPAPGANADPPLLQAMTQALAAIAGDATRLPVP